MTDFENARTYAQLVALAAALKGRALQAALDAVGLDFLRAQSVARKRESLVNYFGRGLDSAAIARMTR